MKRYRITYKQKFMGEIIESSYNKYVRDERELHKAIDALYDDPHVFFADYEELKKED